MDVDHTQTVPTATPSRKGLQKHANIPHRLSFATLPRAALRVASGAGALPPNSVDALVVALSPVRSRTKSTHATPSPRQRLRTLSQFSRKKSNTGSLNLSFRSLKKRRSTSSLTNFSGNKSAAKRVRSSTALVVSATALWTSASRLTGTAKRLITRRVSSSVGPSPPVPKDEPRTYADVATQAKPELYVMDVEDTLIGDIYKGAVSGGTEAVEEPHYQDLDLGSQDMDICESPVSPLVPLFFHLRRNPVEVTQHHRLKSMQKLGVESYKDVMEKYPVSAEEEALAYKCY